MKTENYINEQIYSAFRKAFDNYAENFFEERKNTYICIYKDKIYNLSSNEEVFSTTLPDYYQAQIKIAEFDEIPIEHKLSQLFNRLNSVEKYNLQNKYLEEVAEASRKHIDTVKEDSKIKLSVYKKKFPLLYSEYVEIVFNKAYENFIKSEERNYIFDRLMLLYSCAKPASEINICTIISQIIRYSDINISNEIATNIAYNILSANIL